MAPVVTNESEVLECFTLVDKAKMMKYSFSVLQCPSTCPHMDAEQQTVKHWRRNRWV